MLILLLVTGVVAVPTMYLAAPAFYRWQRVRWLTAENPQKRQEGLTYVVAHAEADEAVRRAAIDRLGVEDATNFLQIVWALQSAGVWQRGHIPDGSWLRWNGLMALEPDAEAGSLVAQRLAGLYDLASDERMVVILWQLLDRPEADVRYNALCAVAELTMSADVRKPYVAMVRQMTKDEEPMIARHAWLFLHAMGESVEAGPDWLIEAVATLKRPLDADEHYDFEAIDALLRSPLAPLRDVGCVLAVRDLEAKVLDGLIEALLNDEDYEAVWSGAMLCGMTGKQTDALTQRLNGETDWMTDRMLRLGFWMRSEGTGAGYDPELLLAHADVPRTTVMMAMMGRWGLRGVEGLLNPRGEPAEDLIELLEDYGWWRVLNYYLPDDAPRWRPDGHDASGADQTRLQVDMLRDWYLVHRRRLAEKRSAIEY